MGRRITLNLDADTDEKLSALAAGLGCGKELAAIYAVRLVSACVREGLIDDVPARAWPEEIEPFASCGARVLHMPAPCARGKN